MIQYGIIKMFMFGLKCLETIGAFSVKTNLFITNSISVRDYSLN